MLNDRRVAEATDALRLSKTRQVDGTDPVAWPDRFAGRTEDAQGSQKLREIILMISVYICT